MPTMQMVPITARPNPARRAPIVSGSKKMGGGGLVGDAATLGVEVEVGDTVTPAREKAEAPTAAFFPVTRISTVFFLSNACWAFVSSWGSVNSSLTVVGLAAAVTVGIFSVPPWMADIQAWLLRLDLVRKLET